MDAYSVRYKDPLGRNLSRIYEDPQPTWLDSPVVSFKSLLSKRPITMQPSKQEPSHTGAKPHVAVIGAGIAGLRCADVLLQNGCQVTVIEARDRIGGRIYQHELPNGHSVDMGPNWIHGTNNNPIQHLAKLTGTSCIDYDATTSLFDKAGKVFPTDAGNRYSTIVWDIVQDAFKYSIDASRSRNPDDLIDANRSLYDFFKERVVEKIPETEEDHEAKREIVLQLSTMWGAYVGSPVNRQSLRFFWLEECIEGENLFCAGTYKHILKVIAEPVLAGAEILLNTKVEKISWQSESRLGPKLKLQDGRSMQFDEVVVTAPLGWLKQNQKAFEPSLPPRLTQAIDSLGYGCLEKVYISFPKAFWLTEDDKDRNSNFLQWLKPEYAPMNPDGWNQEVVELASLEEGLAHPTLLFYIYGDQSEYIVNHMAMLQTQKDKDDFIFKYFEPYYSKMPNYSESNPDCKPSVGVATAWLRDELSGNGSYTNFQVGLEEADEDVLTLRTGMPDNGVWFAGEHTSPYVALGTTTGAYWSGEAVAQRIVHRYKGTDRAQPA